MRFSPRAVQLYCGPIPKDAADLWEKIIAERVGRELPLPAAAAEREQILRRVTLDLCGQSPTPEEIAAFVADDPSTAQAALMKRLLNRPGIAPFTGTLSPGDIHFRVLAATPDAAKKPPAIAFTASEVLENLKKHDAIFESGFSVSGTVVQQFPVNADTGERRREKRRWKFTHDGDRWGLEGRGDSSRKTSEYAGGG